MLAIPTSAKDFRSVNRIFGMIRRKAVAVSAVPIVRRLIVTDFSTDTQGGGTGIFSYIKNVTLSKEFLRLGYTIHIIAQGEFVRGAAASTLQLWVVLDSDEVLEFDARSVPSTITSTWAVEAYILVEATGASGTVRTFGSYSFRDGNNATPSSLTSIIVGGTGTVVSTTPNHLLQINARHGNANDLSYLRLLIVDIMQS